jgi:hypothetical protein
VIPQIPIMTVLSKFDGKTVVSDPKKNQTRKYRVIRLPEYLIIHLKRFTKNNFFNEKNPTIVSFPVKNLEMRDYLASIPVRICSVEIELCVFFFLENVLLHVFINTH